MLDNKQGKPTLLRKNREWEIKLGVKNQKARSKRARQGWVVEIIKNRCEEAKEGRISRRSWQQPQKGPGWTVVPGK